MPKLPTRQLPQQRKIIKLKAWQIRILQALKTSGKWHTRADIPALANVHPSNQTNAWGLGAVNPVKRTATEAKIGYPTLLTLGYVEERNLEIEEGVFERTYRITPEGVQALKSQVS